MVESLPGQKASVLYPWSHCPNKADKLTFVPDWKNSSAAGIEKMGSLGLLQL